MSFDLILVLLVLAGATIAFATEWVTFDVTALSVLVVLLLGGVLTPEDALSGFSDRATVTIAAMFVLSESLRRTGVLERAGDFFRRVGADSYTRAFVAMTATVTVVSAFINNTAAVAIFIPLVMSLSRDLEVSPSKLLMPLSFMSMIGGVCTLIGTSTNLLVSNLAEESGLEPIGMFELSALGLPFLGLGFLYLFTVGAKWVPRRAEGRELTSRYDVRPFVTEVTVPEASPLAGRKARHSRIFDDLDFDIVGAYRRDEDSELIELNLEADELAPGDILRIRAGPEVIGELSSRRGIELAPSRNWADEDLEAKNLRLVEAVIAPESELVNRPLSEAELYDNYGAVALAIRSRGQLSHDSLSEVRLSAGDSLLLLVQNERVRQLQSSRLFVLATAVETEDLRYERAGLSVAILALVVCLPVLTPLPIVATALAGCVLAVLSGILTTREAYRAINWKVIFLLAGVIPLSSAMKSSGADVFLNTGLVSGIQWLGGAHAAVGVFFAVALVLTNLISNQATAALLAPMAISAGDQLGVSPRMLLIAVTFAASLSFLTPVGYQTNTMIYGPGQYRFTDFLKVGALLDGLFLIVATIFIPIIWSTS